MLSRFVSKAAILSCDFITNDLVCFGGLDCEVKLYSLCLVLNCRYDFQKKQERVIGYHDAAVSCTLYIDSMSKRCFPCYFERAS